VVLRLSLVRNLSMSQNSSDRLSPRTKGSRMRRRIRIKRVNTNNLVIRSGRQKLPTRGEPHGVNCTRMVAHRSQLSGLRTRRIAGIVDGVR